MIKYVKFKELPVIDQERALSFYTHKLGLRVVQDALYINGDRWIELEIAGAQTNILFVPRSDQDSTESPQLALAVSDVAEVYEGLRAKRVTFTQAPTVAEWDPEETYALFRDSEGNTVLLSSK
jgi:catechol 2,3-dioxygenase-like lactoylglutathione lyase family enzyme